MSVLKLALKALKALEAAADYGLQRDHDGIWRLTGWLDGGMQEFEPSLVEKLLELKLVHATSSREGYPRKVKATKAGRDLLEGGLA